MLISKLKNTFKILYNIKHLFTSPKTEPKKKKKKKKRVNKVLARLEVEMLALKSLNLAISLCTPPNISTLNVL